MSKDDMWHLYAASVYGAILARHSFWSGENGIVTTESVDVQEMELAMQTAAKAADQMVFFMARRDLLRIS